MPTPVRSALGARDDRGLAGEAAGPREVQYHSRDFWSRENLKYEDPHFRLVKCARIVNRLAGEDERTLLDVGCGPATLARFLRPTIRYHGIDIALAQRGPDLRELDIVSTPIAFDGRRFDLVVAQGLFEYLGDVQTAKLAEIRGLLEPGGRFVTSFVNFSHRQPLVYWPYNNVQSPGSFLASLSSCFIVERVVPTAHNWNHSEPNRPLVRAANLRLDARIPWVTSVLAVEYLYVCRARS